MSETIQGHINNAVVHERAATADEAHYSAHMRLAGAEMCAAFVMACKAAPGKQGRKIDDAAIQNIYRSGKHPAWWAAQLAISNIRQRDKRAFALRLLQWHFDHSLAQSQRTKNIALAAAAQKKAADRAFEKKQAERDEMAGEPSEPLPGDKRDSTKPVPREMRKEARQCIDSARLRTCLMGQGADRDGPFTSDDL